mmetsp:Transcript_3228/g.10079  ORF Transcript_3228/g.10079 Transcript_3228/m.10079 type:complete len:249 (-) Transcript_3228:1105-1851(-)
MQLPRRAQRDHGGVWLRGRAGVGGQVQRDGGAPGSDHVPLADAHHVAGAAGTHPADSNVRADDGHRGGGHRCRRERGRPALLQHDAVWGAGPGPDLQPVRLLRGPRAARAVPGEGPPGGRHPVARVRRALCAVQRAAVRVLAVGAGELRDRRHGLHELYLRGRGRLQVRGHLAVPVPGALRGAGHRRQPQRRRRRVQCGDPVRGSPLVAAGSGLQPQHAHHQRVHTHRRRRGALAGALLGAHLGRRAL